MGTNDLTQYLLAVFGVD
ncbi:MAG: hypothetical protein HY017_26280 [Betaproteobacteria bacterium]|nr:hypothetical protein [Betaproteobacteria bacterium]